MRKSIEAFARYNKAKESLGEYTQIGAAAMRSLEKSVDIPSGADVLGALVDACEVPYWTKGKKFHSAAAKVRKIGDMLCNQILVQHVASFDLFSRKLIADFSTELLGNSPGNTNPPYPSVSDHIESQTVDFTRCSLVPCVP